MKAAVAVKKERWSEEEYRAMNEKYTLWLSENPLTGPTERLKVLTRLYEKHMYGVTSRDLTLGRTIEYVKNSNGTFKRVEAACRGYFEMNLNDRSAPLTCHWERDKFEEVKGRGDLTYQELLDDHIVLRNNRDQMIKLVTDTQSTISGVPSDSMLESGVATGFGTGTGVVPPVFINMLLELTSLKAFMKNFISMQPMPDMTFKFPLKTSRIEDSGEMQRTAVPTVEGRAGTEYEINWANYEINGWKYLRHSELTNEVGEMLDKFLGVTQKYMEELALGQTLLWDYAAIEGIQQMMVMGTWRYPELSAGSFTWEVGAGTEEEIPFGKAVVLTVNALKNYLFQDLSGGGNDGKIYQPSIVTTEEFEYDSATLRSGSSGTDDILEGLGGVATLLKNKHSALEFACISESRVTERLMKDARMANLEIRTGDPVFQSEDGYLGQIAILGSSTFCDLWEAPNGLIPLRPTDDTAADDAFPIICGKYGEGWHQGVFSPVSMRVDEGFEALDDAASVTRLRPTESKVLTTSSKGSSWPGDYNHIAILWAMLDDGHV